MTPQEMWSAYERRRVACQARDQARAACPSTPLRKSASEKAQAKRKALRAAMYEAECEADTARDAWARTSRSAALAWLSPMLDPMRAKAQEALPKLDFTLRKYNTSPNPRGTNPPARMRGLRRRREDGQDEDQRRPHV